MEKKVIFFIKPWYNDFLIEMEERMKRSYYLYSTWYFLMYFALGSFFPLFSQLLSSFKLEGSTLGIIFSIGSFATIISQPFWGFVNDKMKKPKKLISFLLISSSIAIFCFFFTKGAFVVSLVYLIFMFFNSGTGSISDSSVLSSGIPFGKVRLWGSIGYAIGVQFAGLVSEKLGIKSILIIYIVFMILTVLIMKTINFNKAEVKKIQLSDIKELVHNKKYLLAALGCFLVGGSVTGNNNYFGLLYKELGGSIAGIGLAFLLFAGSEAPFMMFFQKVSRKINLVHGLIFVSGISAIRWILYSYTSNPNVLLWSFLLQGISVGGYLVFTTLYIAEVTEEKVRTTALSLFGALSMGLGGMVLQYFSGKIMAGFGISKVYVFFAIANIIAVGIFMRLNSKKI